MTDGQRSRRHLRRHRPGEPGRSSDIGHRRGDEDQRGPRPVGVAELLRHSGQVGELRGEEVRRAGEDDDEQQRLAIDSLELREVHLVDAGLLLHLLGHVGQQPVARLELAARRPVEDSGLDQGQTAADDIGAELRDGEPHGARRVSGERSRDQRLRDVQVELGVVGGERRDVQPNEPDARRPRPESWRL